MKMLRHYLHEHVKARPLQVTESMVEGHLVEVGRSDGMHASFILMYTKSTQICTYIEPINPNRTKLNAFQVRNAFSGSKMHLMTVQNALDD